MLVDMFTADSPVAPWATKPLKDAVPAAELNAAIDALEVSGTYYVKGGAFFVRRPQPKAKLIEAPQGPFPWPPREWVK